MGVFSGHLCALQALRQTLDPSELAHTVDRKFERMAALADRRLSPKSASPRSHSVTF
jgi:hypothetical protein